MSDGTSQVVNEDLRLNLPVKVWATVIGAIVAIVIVPAITITIWVTRVQAQVEANTNETKNVISALASMPDFKANLTQNTRDIDKLTQAIAGLASIQTDLALVRLDASRERETIRESLDNLKLRLDRIEGKKP